MRHVTHTQIERARQAEVRAKFAEANLARTTGAEQRIFQ